MASKGKFRNKPHQSVPRVAPLEITPCEQRLQNLALELSLAGGEVLKENFGFTTEQVNKWLDLTIARAKEQRNGVGTQEIDSPRK